MGVRQEVYFVDWDIFQKQILSEEDWENHVDDWELLDGLKAATTFTYDSSLAPVAFLMKFDAFKRAWRSDEKLHFKEVFDTLFSQGRDQSCQVMELREDGDGDDYAIQTALNPETVKELLRSASKLDLDGCRPLYEAHVHDVSSFRSFEEWRDYGEEWLGVLRRAGAEDRGLIVAYFG